MVKRLQAMTSFSYKRPADGKPVIIIGREDMSVQQSPENEPNEKAELEAKK